MRRGSFRSLWSGIPHGDCEERSDVAIHSTGSLVRGTAPVLTLGLRALSDMYISLASPRAGERCHEVTERGRNPVTGMQTIPCVMRPPSSFRLAEKKMVRARARRKGRLHAFRLDVLLNAIPATIQPCSCSNEAFAPAPVRKELALTNLHRANGKSVASDFPPSRHCEPVRRLVWQSVLRLLSLGESNGGPQFHLAAMPMAGLLRDGPTKARLRSGGPAP